MRLKAERAAEERRMEDEFKQRLMLKYAEDERLEQMNAQRGECVNKSTNVKLNDYGRKN